MARQIPQESRPECHQVGVNFFNYVTTNYIIGRDILFACLIVESNFDHINDMNNCTEMTFLV